MADFFSILRFHRRFHVPKKLAVGWLEAFPPEGVHDFDETTQLFFHDFEMIFATHWA